MADKPIGELSSYPYSAINGNMLFVVQAPNETSVNTAYKLTAQQLENWLVATAQGHGGIQNITKTSTAGLVDTYTITYADLTTSVFQVTNAKSITSIAKTGTVGRVDTYTITFNDTSTTTFTVTNGEKGDMGDAWYVWIRYAGQEPTRDSDMGTTPDKWIGIYSGTSSTAPTHYTSYNWYEYKGEKGDTGDPAEITNTEVVYGVSTSSSAQPASWTASVPTTAEGQYLWTRTTITFNSGQPVVSYQVSYHAINGTGAGDMTKAVFDPDGDVESAGGIPEYVSANGGKVETINNVAPEQGTKNVLFRITDLLKPTGSDSYSVDSSPTSGSTNLVTSGGIFTAIAGFLSKITTGSGTRVYTHNGSTQSDLDIDSTPKSGSNNLITSGGVASALSNPNLLDNPWFTVNQRGFESDSSTTEQKYTFDRWMCRRGTYSALTNGIAIAWNGETADGFNLQQRFETNKLNIGDSVTVSIKKDDGIVSASLSVTSSAVYTELATNLSVSVNKDSNFLYVNIKWASTATLNIYAVKFELGSVSTLANDTAPNYAEELLKCQRYFIAIHSTGNLNFNGYVTGNGKAYRINVPIKTNMRIKPTITGNPSFIVRGISGYDTGFTQDSSHVGQFDSIEMRAENTDCGYISIQGALVERQSSLLNNTPINLQFNSGYIYLSADF